MDLAEPTDRSSMLGVREAGAPVPAQSRENAWHLSFQLVSSRGVTRFEVASKVRRDRAIFNHLAISVLFNLLADH